MSLLCDVCLWACVCVSLLSFGDRKNIFRDGRVDQLGHRLRLWGQSGLLFLSPSFWVAGRRSHLQNPRIRQMQYGAGKTNRGDGLGPQRDTSGHHGTSQMFLENDWGQVAEDNGIHVES